MRIGLELLTPWSPAGDTGDEEPGHLMRRGRPLWVGPFVFHVKHVPPAKRPVITGR
ncbi:hypothetical protein SAMN05216505_11127 [Streptomyces prasinopilosus]|uniref:Uncharacterized protein n=1 Tax=Streptomyces prasinopilosus TaxID=67344 RepID=A0A1G6X1F4_9ACTN|nr:hypothetical protein SAMN05216505_11127 [Streptomyces prasinopilosus]